MAAAARSTALAERQDLPDINETLEYLKGKMPETVGLLEYTFEELEYYEKNEHYKKHPQQAIEILGKENLSSFAHAINDAIKDEFEKLADSEKERVKSYLELISKHIEKTMPLLDLYNRAIFQETPVRLRLRTETLYIPPPTYRIPEDRPLSGFEANQFMKECGLERLAKRGSGDHAMFKDPRGEMKGKNGTPGDEGVWLSFLIKDLVNSGLPLRRIKAACDSMRINLIVNN